MCKYTFEHSAALKNVMTALKQDEICLVIKLWDSLIRCVFVTALIGTSCVSQLRLVYTFISESVHISFC